MKKILILLTLTMMFGQTKLETRAYELDLNWSKPPRPQKKPKENLELIKI